MSVSDKFAVYHDFWKASDIRIHRIDCGKYRHRKQNPTTVEWLSFPSYQDAENMAKKFSVEDGIKYSDCTICKPSGAFN